jgi:Phospholipase_D-nuclease N-terminal
MTEKNWSDLSKGQRNTIKILAVTELALKVLMLLDIRRRPASEIRGPKGAWRAAAIINTIGPVSYFLFGRRRG